MKKSELFIIYLNNNPLVIFFIFVNIIVMHFFIKISLEPFGVEFIDSLFEAIPYWLKNANLIDLVLPNIIFLYGHFEKWCRKKHLI